MEMVIWQIQKYKNTKHKSAFTLHSNLLLFDVVIFSAATHMQRTHFFKIWTIEKIHSKGLIFTFKCQDNMGLEQMTNVEMRKECKQIMIPTKQIIIPTKQIITTTKQIIIPK